MKKMGKICSTSIIKENIQPIHFGYCTINQKNRIVTTDEDINALRDYLSRKKKLEENASCYKTRITFP